MSDPSPPPATPAPPKRSAWARWWPSLPILGLVLTVAALLISSWQTWLAHSQTQDLTAIKESLSTRFLGQFPDYTDDIAELIDSAEREVRIVCDVPGYGIISQPRGWFAMHQAIQRKAQQGVDITATFYDLAQRDRIVTEQINQLPNRLKTWTAPGSPMRDSLQNFIQRYGNDLSIDELTFDQYLAVSRDAHEQVLDTTYFGVNHHTTARQLPLYFWLVDGREAIIAIPTYGDASTEYGFRTTDGNFIEALADIARRYDQNPAPPDPAP